MPPTFSVGRTAELASRQRIPLYRHQQDHAYRMQERTGKRLAKSDDRDWTRIIRRRDCHGRNPMAHSGQRPGTDARPMPGKPGAAPGPREAQALKTNAALPNDVLDPVRRSNRPIFQEETRYPSEVAAIRRDHDQLPGQPDRSDFAVLRADTNQAKLLKVRLRGLVEGDDRKLDKEADRLLQ
jgi:hypothetical protein